MRCQLLFSVIEMQLSQCVKDIKLALRTMRSSRTNRIQFVVLRLETTLVSNIHNYIFKKQLQQLEYVFEQNGR